MKIENLEDLFLHTLQDIYFAEKQIVKAMPKMAQARLGLAVSARCLVGTVCAPRTGREPSHPPLARQVAGNARPWAGG